MMTHVNTWLGDNLETSGTVSNLRTVCQIKKSLVYNKLSNDGHGQYLDGWPFSNSKYSE